MREDYFDDPNSPALAKWADALGAYLDGQDCVEPLRRRVQPNPPWPDQDSPMLAYLVERATEMEKSDGLTAALVWLAVHAWFEAVLDERARIVRNLTA